MPTKTKKLITRNFILSFSLFFSLFFMTHCSQVQSGRYVSLSSPQSFDQLAAQFKVPVDILKRANLGKNPSVVGEWIFIPEPTGILGHKNYGKNHLSQDQGRFPASIGVLPTRQYLWPVPSIGQISSPFGRRWGRHHDGMDIPARKGTPFVAAESGIVVHAGNEKLGGYGRTIVLAHTDGFFTVYAHNSKNLVNIGQTVNKGDVIGLIGNTGRSTGPHLHFEVRFDSEPLNPIAFLYGRPGHDDATKLLLSAEEAILSSDPTTEYAAMEGPSPEILSKTSKVISAQLSEKVKQVEDQSQKYLEQMKDSRGEDQGEILAVPDTMSEGLKEENLQAP